MLLNWLKWIPFLSSDTKMRQHNIIKDPKITSMGMRFLKETNESKIILELVSTVLGTKKSAATRSISQSKSRSNPAAFIRFTLRNIRYLSLCQHKEYTWKVDRKFRIPAQMQWPGVLDFNLCIRKFLAVDVAIPNNEDLSFIKACG
jgi:hypothetical protein